MIGALNGTTVQIYKNPILLLVHDVGYNVYITETLRRTLAKDSKLFLFIHAHIREDAFDLFGFPDEKELQCFELLLTVSGIGPKTALTIMDRGVAAIEKAITSSDVDFFTTVPRLGTKNAQKIIIELRSKLGGIGMADLSGATGDTKELLDALVSMGFQKKEAGEIIKTIPSDITALETRLKYCLSRLGKRL